MISITSSVTIFHFLTPPDVTDRQDLFGGIMPINRGEGERCPITGHLLDPLPSVIEFMFKDF